MITSYFIQTHIPTGILYVTVNTKDKWTAYTINKVTPVSGVNITFDSCKETTENIDIEGFNSLDYQIFTSKEKDQIYLLCVPLSIIREFNKG